MTKIEFRDRSTVTLIRTMADDHMIAEDARLSTTKDDGTGLLSQLPDRDKGLVRSLMRERHSVPFEAPQFTFEVETPIFVTREAMRHRNMSFSEMSGRYIELPGVFWVPPPTRPLVQVGKAMEYRLEPGSPEQYTYTRGIMETASARAWVDYQYLLQEGVAKEVARTVLPVNIFTRWRVRCSLRSALQFCSLRTRDERAEIPSKPMLEIEEVARQIETILEHHCPWAMSAWNEFGRRAL